MTNIETIAQLRGLLAEALAGFTPDPGTSDLDNEQPIHLRTTLGWYRRAYRAMYDRDGIRPDQKPLPGKPIFTTGDDTSQMDGGPNDPDWQRTRWEESK